VSSSDRRLIVARSSSEYCGNNEYFSQLLKCLNTPGMSKAFYDYLMTVDISKFNQADRPETELTRELKQTNKHPLLEWIQQEEECFTEQQLKTTEWLTMYNQWAEANNMRRFNITTFGLAINELIAKNCGISKQKPKNVSKTTIDRDAVMAWMESKNMI
jgi:hypothetical protein